jgi:hypothetical protein
MWGPPGSSIQGLGFRVYRVRGVGYWLCCFGVFGGQVFGVFVWVFVSGSVSYSRVRWRRFGFGVHEVESAGS